MAIPLLLVFLCPSSPSHLAVLLYISFLLPTLADVALALGGVIIPSFRFTNKQTK